MGFFRLWCSCFQKLVFISHLKFVIEFNPFGPSHVFELWMEVREGMLHIKHFSSTNPCFL